MATGPFVITARLNSTYDTYCSLGRLRSAATSANATAPNRNEGEHHVEHADAAEHEGQRKGRQHQPPSHADALVEQLPAGPACDPEQARPRRLRWEAASRSRSRQVLRWRAPAASETERACRCTEGRRAEESSSCPREASRASTAHSALRLDPSAPLRRASRTQQSSRQRPTSRRAATHENMRGDVPRRMVLYPSC